MYRRSAGRHQGLHCQRGAGWRRRRCDRRAGGEGARSNSSGSARRTSPRERAQLPMRRTRGTQGTMRRRENTYTRALTHGWSLRQRTDENKPERPPFLPFLSILSVAGNRQARIAVSNTSRTPASLCESPAPDAGVPSPHREEQRRCATTLCRPISCGQRQCRRLPSAHLVSVVRVHVDKVRLPLLNLRLELCVGAEILLQTDQHHRSVWEDSRVRQSAAPPRDSRSRCWHAACASREYQ